MQSAIAHHQPTDAQPVLEQPPLPVNSPHFHDSAWCYMVWKVSLASLGQQSWFWPFPTSCAPQHPCWQSSMRSMKIMRS